MTLNIATESEVCMDHALNKLSCSVRTLSRLILRYKTITAVIKLPVQYSKVLGSSYEVSF